MHAPGVRNQTVLEERARCKNGQEFISVGENGGKLEKTLSRAW